MQSGLFAQKAAHAIDLLDLMIASEIKDLQANLTNQLGHYLAGMTSKRMTCYHTTEERILF